LARLFLKAPFSRMAFCSVLDQGNDVREKPP
jgi:hypothetical protein